MFFRFVFVFYKCFSKIIKIKKNNLSFTLRMLLCMSVLIGVFLLVLLFFLFFGCFSFFFIIIILVNLFFGHEEPQKTQSTSAHKKSTKSDINEVGIKAVSNFV